MTVTNFKNSTEFIAFIKAIFGASNDAELNNALGALTTEEIMDKIAADPQGAALTEELEKAFAANPNVNFIAGTAIDADDINILDIIKKLKFAAPKATGGVTTASGRLVNAGHLAKNPNPAQTVSLNVKLMTISTLDGERFQVNRTSGGKQQRVVIAALLPNGQMTQFGVNEEFVKNLIERAILDTAGKIIAAKAYVAVNVMQTKIGTTYVETDAAVVAWAEKQPDAVVIVRKGTKGVLLKHDTELQVFRGIIGTVDADIFKRAEEKSDKLDEMKAQTEQAIRIENAKATSELEFLKAVKTYAAENDMSLAKAAEELALLRGTLGINK
jgi:hypothetical protein